MKPIALAIVVTVGLASGLGCSKTTRDEPAQQASPAPPPSPRKNAAAPAVLTVTSTAFSEGGSLPSHFTCDGRGISPPIAWSEPPNGTKSFAVVLEDPDAPAPDAPDRKTFVHWIVYGIPSAARSLPEGMALAANVRTGVNDFGRVGYGGPCPPRGQHRYVFKVYALDDDLADLHLPKSADLDRAIDGHVLAEGHLVGMYARRAAS